MAFAIDVAVVGVDAATMLLAVMHRLQKLPDIVAGFFGTPTCAYAQV